MALSACSVSFSAGGESLDVDKGEQLIEDQIEANTGFAVERVDCPERRISQGDQFECTAIIDGQPLRIQVTQTDDDGQIEGEPLQAVIDVAKATTVLTDEIRSQTGVAVTVTCSDKRALVQDVGSTFDCQARLPNGTSQRVMVTVKDVEGNVDFRVG
ncbi:MAG: DUF4333 domain-containing protein [Acidimicrobiales bacterium]